MAERQLDLFSHGESRGGDRRSWGTSSCDIRSQPAPRATALGDDALIQAIPDAGLTDAPALAAEAARRRLSAAVPALERLCRRFVGFGADRAIPEQVAAVTALAGIGGPVARQALAGLIATRVVQGPGLVPAMAAARQLGVDLPADLALMLLRHDDSRIRADACGCVRATPGVLAVLDELMADSEADVRCAAACALGRFGRPEARAPLAALLRDRPTAVVIEAIAAVADEACIILLGRIARSVPELTEAARDALEGIEHPRAAQVLAASINSDAIKSDTLR